MKSIPTKKPLNPDNKRDLPGPKQDARDFSMGTGDANRVRETGENVSDSKPTIEAIDKRVKDIESGKVPPVDKAILEQAREAIDPLNGGGDASKDNLNKVLELLHADGRVDDPQGFLNQVLDFSEEHQKTPPTINLN